jgi:UDP-GlcNAc:undecaprenyl-phosphate GlcNAc-1-phosphate transferase
MGDTGSQLLGFLASTLSMTLTQGNTPLSPLLPLALLGFPILDTLTVMLARMAAGHSPFRADKNHFHHKLLRLGLYHSEAVITIYSLQFFLVACAYIFRSYSEFFLILFYGLFSGTILFGFFLAHKTRWRLKRYDLFDKVIKGRLRVLKEKNILIKFSFRFVEVMAPSLLLFTAVLPSNIPRHFGLLSITLLLIIILVWGTNHKWRHNALAIALYLFIPYLLYISETHQVTWMNKDILFVYNMSFGVLIFFTYLTLKFTRRRNGFKSTPMDFLILFMVLIIPNLPDGRIQSYRIGMLAMKTIVFFLSYEVIIGELRVQSKRLGLSTMAVLIVMGLRGILG